MLGIYDVVRSLPSAPPQEIFRETFFGSLEFSSSYSAKKLHGAFRSEESTDCLMADPCAAGRDAIAHRNIESVPSYETKPRQQHCSKEEGVQK